MGSEDSKRRELARTLAKGLAYSAPLIVAVSPASPRCTPYSAMPPALAAAITWPKPRVKAEGEAESR